MELDIVHIEGHYHYAAAATRTPAAIRGLPILRKYVLHTKKLSRAGKSQPQCRSIFARHINRYGSCSLKSPQSPEAKEA